jgi:hypothetical protein
MKPQHNADWFARFISIGALAVSVIVFFWAPEDLIVTVHPSYRSKVFEKDIKLIMAFANLGKQQVVIDQIEYLQLNGHSVKENQLGQADIFEQIRLQQLSSMGGAHTVQFKDDYLLHWYRPTLQINNELTQHDAILVVAGGTSLVVANFQTDAIETISKDEPLEIGVAIRYYDKCSHEKLKIIPIAISTLPGLYNPEPGGQGPIKLLDDFWPWPRC